MGGVVVESLEWYFECMDLLDATWPHVAEAADEEHHDDAVDEELDIDDIDDGVYHAFLGAIFRPHRTLV